MIYGCLLLALLMLSLSASICFYRVIKGPTHPDRILALDAISYNIIGIVAVTSVLLGTQAYLAVILVIGILAFLGTIAIARFVERGVVIEHRRSD